MFTTKNLWCFFFNLALFPFREVTRLKLRKRLPFLFVLKIKK